MGMKLGLSLMGALLAVLILPGLLASPWRSYDSDLSPELPEFVSRSPADWINSPPLSIAELRGQVVLIDVWTFQCWNCYRSFPWLNSLEDRFSNQPFRVVGIHSPEFKAERDRAAVKAAVKRFKLDHPVMIDNDHAYWQALDNRYWPAYYLVDADGHIRAVHIGETHIGDAQARLIESSIRTLLNEAQNLP